MNTQVNIIAAIILIIIFLPIYFLHKSGYTYLKKLTKKLDAIASTNNLNLVQKEGWGNSCIGIDKSQQKLLYKRGLENDDYHLINLRDIQSCEIVKEVSQRRIEKTFVTELKTLDLKLIAKNNRAAITLNFYDIDNNHVEDFELQRIEKWAQIINAQLSTQDYRKVA